jgi:hypothetical protein
MPFFFKSRQSSSSLILLLLISCCTCFIHVCSSRHLFLLSCDLHSNILTVITCVQLKSSSNWLWSLSLSLSNQLNLRCCCLLKSKVKANLLTFSIEHLLLRTWLYHISLFFHFVWCFLKAIHSSSDLCIPYIFYSGYPASSS